MRSAVLLFLAFLLANAGALEHVILSFTGDLSEMQVTFRSVIRPLNPVIKYGIGTTDLSVAISASQITYFRNSTSNSASDSYLAVVILTGLQRGATYTYAITVDSKASPVAWTTNTFKTLPDGASFPLRLALFGDLGAQSKALNSSFAGSLNRYVANGAIDAVFHFGDMAYNMDSYSGRQGNAFMKAISPISSRIPYIGGAGNHEYHNNAYAYYQAFFAQQRTLGARSASTDPTTFFSLNVGDTHFVMINTEYVCTTENTNITKIIAQYNWLKTDLAAAATSGKWIVVMGHRPFYSGYYQDHASVMLREGIQCTDSTLKTCSIVPCTTPTSTSCGYGMEKLFAQYKVDFLFQGHTHYYKRSLPQGNGIFEQQPDAGNYLNPQLPIPIITGAAGTQHGTFKRALTPEQVAAEAQADADAEAMELIQAEATRLAEAGHEVVEGPEFVDVVSDPFELPPPTKTTTTTNQAEAAEGTTATATAAVAAGTGLRGYYYSGMEFNTSLANRVDPTINFDWAAEAPTGIAGAPINRWSARWKGYILPKCTGSYTFTTAVDDGVRLYVKGVKIIEDWVAHSLSTKTGTISLVANVYTAIQVDYFDNTSTAKISLSWQSGTCEPKAIIPTSRLYLALPATAAPATPAPTPKPATPAPAVATPKPPTLMPGALPTYVVAYGSDETPSWTLMTITDGSHLSISQIAIETGAVIDHFTVTHAGTARAVQKTRALSAPAASECSQ